VFIERCHLRCLASRRTNIVLVLCCVQIVVVALKVDGEGLDVIFIDSIMDDATNVRDVGGCVKRMIYYISGVHLLWF